MTGNHACPVTLSLHKENQPMDLWSHVIPYLKPWQTWSQPIWAWPATALSTWGSSLQIEYQENYCLPNSMLLLIKASSPFNRTLSSFSSLTRNLETGFMFSWNRMFYVPDFFVLLSLMSYLKACLFKIEKYKQLRSLLKQRNEDQTSYNLKIT